MTRIARSPLNALRQLSGRSTTPEVASADQMRRVLEILRDDGVEVACAIDVGACRGEWTQLLRVVYPDCSVLLVEPQPQHAAALGALVERATAPTYYSGSLVGAEPRSAVPFHVMDDGFGGTGSSVLRELSDVPSSEIRLEMTTVSRLIEDFRLPLPDLLKLDVQGYELEVLRGLGDRLMDVDFILAEVAILPYNEGAPLFAEVVAWLADAGFLLHDIAGETRLDGDRLVQLDVLFANAAHPSRRVRRFHF